MEQRQFEKLSRQTTVLLSILMILSGLTLLVGSIILLPAQADVFDESSTLSPLSPMLRRLLRSLTS